MPSSRPWSPFAKGSAALVALALAAALCTEGSTRAWLLGAAAIAWTCGVVVGVLAPRLALFGPAIVRAPTIRNVAALTFDDGPDPAVTPALLDLLRDLDVRATFFCVGRRVEAEPAIARRIHAEGHLIGNHSYGHAWWTNFLLTAGMRRELERAQEAIARVVGVHPGFFRPPMGLTNPHVHRAVDAAGLRLVAWDAGGWDQRARDPARVVDRIARALRSGSIVLLHDADTDADRLLTIVRGVVASARARGFTFLRLDDLLAPQA